MPPKSIFKRPGARHFQLVHRSQRDPLIHDPDASQHVLKPISKGKAKADLESALSPDDLAHDLERANIGEAAIYGVYFDDTEYDYMQHLRQAGVQEDGVEVMLIEAPSSSSSAAVGSKAAKRKGKGRDEEFLRDLPPEALASAHEMPRDYGSQQAVPAELVGLQPDMDPHLRQALEALEDDAFVDDALEDDFFAELVEGGEREEEDEPDFEFDEDGIDEGEETEKEDNEEEGEEGREEDWEARFRKFKKEHEAKARAREERGDGSDVASEPSEGRDTVGQLPALSVIGGKRRRRGTSDASGYSMSSSSMFRNKGLTLLDERFDQIEKEYASDEEVEDEELSEDSDEAPQLITSREDFNAIMDDFLDNYEILGGKMRHVLPGETVTEKLGTIRQSLREIGYDAKEQLAEDEDEGSDDAFDNLVEEKADRWDCETILSTYSNLENHPRLIKAREARNVPKIHLDPKTGLPSVLPQNPPKTDKKVPLPDEEDHEETYPVRVTVARPKDESKEEKRLRKQAVKEERQARRAEKKTTKSQYSNEKKHQMQILANVERKGIKKL